MPADTAGNAARLRRALPGSASRSGLAASHRGGPEAAKLASARQVVIACPDGVFHFLIMPRYAVLRRVLAENIQIRVLTCHHYPERAGRPRSGRMWLLKYGLD